MTRRSLRLIISIALGISLNSQAQYHTSTETCLSANGMDELAYDLFIPEQQEHEGWCVIFVHGGGFSGGSRQDAPNQTYCRKLAQKGIAVVSMDYRLRQTGRGFHCDIARDEKREAIRWAAEDLNAVIEAVSLRFPNGIIACGSSAGAEAVLDAAFNMKLPQIDGVISLAGAIEPRADWVSVPILAFHGTCDALVPFCVAAHHYCPQGSPGDLELMGGGGLAQANELVQLFAFENAGHELASTMLSNPMFIEQSARFTAAIATQTFAPSSITIPLHQPCPLPSSPTFPCD